MNRAGRVIVLLWITLTCCTLSYADDADEQSCNITWRIVQDQTLDLALEWFEFEKSETLESFTFELSFRAVNADKQCKKTEFTTEVDFAEKKLQLPPLCPNTEYEIDIRSNCTSYRERFWTPPGPPVDVTIPDANITNTSFTVSWKAPSDIAPIDRYIVNVNESLFVNETTGTSLFYSGLLPFATYRVRVTAKIADFLGKPSATVDVRTKAGVPGPPRHVSATSSASSLFLTWEDPEPFVGPIQGYEVEWRSGTSTPLTNTTTEMSYIISGLTPYTTYTVRVRAETSTGKGVWTDEIDYRTDVGIPGPPLNVTVAFSSESSLSLTWEDPEPFVGPVEGFQVEWSAAGDSPKAENTQEKSYTIKNLTPYTNYTLRVRARTSAGNGTWSEEVVHRTDVGLPYPPQNLTVVSHTELSIHLNWDEPVPSTGPILGYGVHWIGGGEEHDCNVTETFVNVTDLKPYTKYKLKVSAFTEAGRGQWTKEVDVQTNVGVPDSPLNVSVSSSTDSSLSLTWEDPDIFVGPIVGFEVDWKAENSQKTDSVKIDKINSYTIENLAPYTNYAIRVRAWTSAGSGRWSEEVVHRTDVGVPSHPTGLEVLSSTDTSLLLTWKEPEPTVGPIEDYEVEWRTSGVPRTDTTKILFYNITGLVPYTLYEMRVRARTSAGKGSWSEYIINRTAVGVPNPPKNLQMKSRTNTSLYFEWEQPEPFKGPILNYSLTCTGASTVESSSTSDTFMNVTRLIPFTDYKVMARAHTDAGPSQWTQPETFKTDVGVPHAPTALNYTSVTNISVSLTWLAPVPSTGPVTMYVIRWSSSRGGGDKETGSNRTEHQVSGLLPYVDYIFQVQAVTTAGHGEWSDPTKFKTDIGVPHAPKAPSLISVTNTSVTLSWKEPTPSTGPISTYVVRWSSPGKAGIMITNSNRTIHEVPGLLPYLNYTFQILAQTNAGRGAASDSIVVETSIGVPHAPMALVRSLVTNTSISLTWKEPTPSTGPILTYVILWSNSRAKSEQKVTGTNLTNYMVSGLVPFVNYTFQVLAETGAGRGEGSNRITVETDIGVPHEPTALERITVTNTSVTLTWKEPFPSTGPLSTYVVLWSSPRGNGERDTRSNVSSYIVDGLLPFVHYTFRVLAITSAGRGKLSGSIKVQTEVGVPHAPKALGYTSVTNTSIALAWKEPEISTGPISTYIVRWSSGRGGDGERDTRSNLPQFQFLGLQPYLNYTFQVQALTMAGRGEWSDKKTIQTDIGIPTFPRNLVPETITDDSVSIKWDQPQLPNGPDLSYEVRWTLASDVNGTEELSSYITTNQLSVQHKISGLLPYTHYSVRVSAMSGAGHGPWSDILLFRTAVGVPKPAVLKNVKGQGSRAALVEWSTVGPYPGPVDYSLQAWMGPGPCSDGTSSYIYAREVKDNMSPEEWNIGLQTNTMTQLRPHGKYYFLIMLRTSATDGVQSEQSQTIQTDPEAAGEPTDVTSDCQFSPTAARVSWKPPKQPNGIIDSYDVEYSMNNKWQTVNVPVQDPCADQSHVLTGLRPERPYKIRVYARVRGVTVSGRTALSEGTCILPAGIPSVGNTSRLLTKSTGFDHVTLEWTRETFSEVMGSIVYYSVLVGRRGTLGNATSGAAVDWGPPWLNFSSGLSDFYQATPPLWNPFNEEPDPLRCNLILEAHLEGNQTLLRCLVGAQDFCPDNETYCNGPLQPETQYEMKIRAFTRGGYTETGLVYARTGPKPRGSAVGAVVAVIVVLLLVASLAAGGYVMKKKGHLDPLMYSIRSRFGLKGGKSTRKPSVQSSLEHLEQSGSPRPIKSSLFSDHVRIMILDSHLKFSQEFEMLKNASPHPPCSVAEMEENRYKNRWMNIFPFDHSRVKLLPLSDEPGSDFINANYIPGYSSKREYIATQGPLPQTIDDFWRMLWEQSVSMVVMLTQCVERGKKKCEQYWPESGEARYYGDLRVGTVSESMLSSYVIRIFHVQLGTHERRIKQMHFTHWPDFGCPERPEDLVNFVRAVRDHLPRPDPGPVLVHCSAGVGRTGTFIAVDRLAQQLSYRHIPQNDLVDVYGTVLELRKHRTNMVQTEDQYIYIHLCVRQLIGEREAPNQEESEDLVYSNIGMQKDTSV